MEQINLGVQLKQIREVALRKKTEAEQAALRAQYERIQAERDQIQAWWVNYMMRVAEQIQKGQEPSAQKMPSWVMQGSYLITHDLHSHHDIWKLRWQPAASNLGLRLLIREIIKADWSSGGYEMRVEPSE
jgi:hypothetical protein